MRRKNFSLVEIVVVVTIICVLIGLGAAGYNYAMQSAKESATRAAMKQVELALDSLKAKFGYFPVALSGTNPNQNGRIYILSAKTGIEGKAPAFDLVSGAMTPNDAAQDLAAKMGVNAEYMAEFGKMIDVESLQKHLEKDTNGYYLVDSWGGQIFFRSPGNVNRTSYDLISAGRDGSFGNFGGSLSDIQSGGKKNYERGDFENCDDLVNFM